MKSFVKYSIFSAGIVLAFWVYRSSAIISAPTGAVSASQQDLTNLQNTIAKDLNTINDRVSGMSKSNEESKNTISDLKNALSKANDSLKKAQDDVVALQKKLDENNRVISTYIDKTSKDLQAQIDKLNSFVEKRLDTINTTINDNKGSFAKIAAQITVLQGQLIALTKPAF
jgi:chromosome segregation ATPase